MLKVLDKYGQINWVTKVRQLLFQMVFDIYGLNNVCRILVRFSLLWCKDKIKIQSWYAELADSWKFCLYKDYKLYYEHETYLNCSNIRTFRHTLSKFRSGCHNLEIKVGRRHGLPRHDRLCRLYKDEVEKEIHFMFQCPVYETLRQKYLPRKYYIFPSVNKFNKLMSSHFETVIHNVATYLYYAFKLRRELLESTWQYIPWCYD